MDAYRIVETKSLLKTLYIRIFSNKYITVAFEIVMTTIISLYTSTTNFESKKWWMILALLIAIYLLINLLIIFADYLNNKSNNIQKFLYDSYLIQNAINYNTASNLYRVNKKIAGILRKGSMEKGEINTIADFQSLAFLVCSELHKFISENCNCEECEITIFQRFIGKDN